MSLINRKVLKRVEKEYDREETQFVTVIYDIPSENRNGLSEEEKSRFRRARLYISRKAGVLGIKVNRSCYIISIERLKRFLRCFERKYEGLEDKEKEVNVKIIGSVYSDVLKGILKNRISERIDEFFKKLELFEAKLNKLDKYSGEDTRKIRKIRRKLYNLSRKEKTLGNRVEDLGKLNSNLSDKYQKDYEKIKEFRKELIGKTRI